MKATGIVRRIDDLGRVVIPKEIRRSVKIREGDPLEIYLTDKGEILLKKYVSDILTERATEVVKTLAKFHIYTTIYDTSGDKIAGYGNSSVENIDAFATSSFVFPIKDASYEIIGYLATRDADPNAEQRTRIETIISMFSLD